MNSDAGVRPRTPWASSVASMQRGWASAGRRLSWMGAVGDRAARIDANIALALLGLTLGVALEVQRNVYLWTSLLRASVILFGITLIMAVARRLLLRQADRVATECCVPRQQTESHWIALFLGIQTATLFACGLLLLFAFSLINV